VWVFIVNSELETEVFQFGCDDHSAVTLILV